MAISTIRIFSMSATHFRRISDDGLSFVNHDRRIRGVALSDRRRRCERASARWGVGMVRAVGGGGRRGGDDVLRQRTVPEQTSH